MNMDYSIRISIGGDFRANNPNRIVIDKTVDYLFKTSDIAICNFEAPVRTEGVMPIKKSGPSLNQSADSPVFLKKAGFNVILLANNHIMDFGSEGLKATIDSFKDITTVGAGTAKEAFEVRYLDIKGHRIGLYSLVQHEFGVVENSDDTECGAAWIGSLDVKNIIIEAKQNCDFLLIFPHAGVEHTAAQLPEWRNVYKHFID
jgi:poly-gamma-glutamate synthesis protein (capsule biosynthesis protein)